jgi:hypothetical protein
MLLEAHGSFHTQHDIAHAAGVTKTIQKAGSRIDQLAQAVTRLAPEYIVLGKYRSTLDDIAGVTSAGTPVGVEWQGRFRAAAGDFDIGHYSIVLSVDRERHRIELVDPDDAGFFRDAPLSTGEFERRWWEDNELEPDKKSRSWGLSFMVVPLSAEAPYRLLGYEPVTFVLVRAASVDL